MEVVTGFAPPSCQSAHSRESHRIQGPYAPCESLVHKPEASTRDPPLTPKPAKLVALVHVSLAAYPCAVRRLHDAGNAAGLGEVAFLAVGHDA